MRRLSQKRQSVSFRSFTTTIETANSAIITTPKKRLDVAIVGLPNAGKSQILNVLTGSRISAVSPKRHTTVQGVLSAKTTKDTQLLFLDTPGFLRQDDAVDRDLMMMSTGQQVTQVDFTLLVVDAARKLTDPVQESLVQLMLQALQAEGRLELDPIEKDQQPQLDNKNLEMKPKFAVVLNKVDLVYPKTDLLDVAEQIGALAEECIWYLHKGGCDDDDDLKQLTTTQRTPQEHEDLILPQMPMFFYVSALARDKDPGMQDLLEFLLQEATPCEEWELEPAEQTNLSPEERVTEVIREQLYRSLHQELPYQIRQRNRFWHVDVHPVTALPQRVQIWQDILVMTSSHRDIVRGQNGRTLEHIRARSAQELQRLFRCPVDLQLHVKLPKSKQQRRSRNWSIE